jgi:hypothetical protein
MRLNWTKDKYIKLCEISDEFLVTRLGSIAEVANVSLHIIRPHPIFLCRYQYALERIPILEIINSLAKALINLLRACRCLLKKKNIGMEIY